MRSVGGPGQGKVIVLDEHRGALAAELRDALGDDDRVGAEVTGTRDRDELLRAAQQGDAALILIASDRLIPDGALARELGRPGGAPWACVTDRASTLAIGTLPPGGVAPRAVLERPVDGPTLADHVRGILWAERVLATPSGEALAFLPRSRAVDIARGALARAFLERTLATTPFLGGVVLETVGGARRLVAARGTTPEQAHELELNGKAGDDGLVADDVARVTVRSGVHGLIALVTGAADEAVRTAGLAALAPLRAATVRALAALPSAPPTVRDATTGLVGRATLLAALDAAITRARNDGGAGPALLMLAIELADPVTRVTRLAALADRLGVLLRAADLPARVGPTMLGVLLPAVGPDGARAVEARLAGALEPLGFGGAGTPMTLGRAAWPQHGAQAIELVACAERAILGR